MSEPPNALQLTAVAIHGDVFPSVDLLTGAFTDVVRRVEQRIRETFPNVNLQPQVLSVSQAFKELDSNCVAAVLDVSNLDRKLSFLSGRLHGEGVPFVTICQHDAKTSWLDLSFHSASHVNYVSLDDLRQANSPLEQQLLNGIPQSRIHDELIYRFWFPRETTTIWVVCPKIHNAGEYAYRSSPDYTYLDNLGDTDALLELMVFLSQYYPKATIKQFSSDDLPDGHTSGNLVVIGGPGSAEISNEICRDMMSMIKSHVTYSDDCEAMRVVRNGEVITELRAAFNTRKKAKVSNTVLARRHGFIATLIEPFIKPVPPEKELAKDWGYFARFQNPLNENATVVLVNGIHTAGVVGAARAFSDRRETMRNYRSVYKERVDVSRFECYFEVPILNGERKVPAVASGNIVQLEPVEPGLNFILERPSAERRSTLQILFVAGDRGDSRINQLQIPKEFHSIQEALRASKHRDVIVLTLPILAATRVHLAHAYRERPTVLHFAGHGNDRSLSIIQDQELLVTSTPMDTEQLCTMIKTMQDRIQLCVLNACMSAELAKEIVAEEIVDFAIGWSGTVGDSTAIAFSAAFYGALGDGRTLQDSFEIGKVACGGNEETQLVVSPSKNANILLVDTGETT